MMMLTMTVKARKKEKDKKALQKKTKKEKGGVKVGLSSNQVAGTSDAWCRKDNEGGCQGKERRRKDNKEKRV